MKWAFSAALLWHHWALWWIDQAVLKECQLGAELWLTGSQFAPISIFSADSFQRTKSWVVFVALPTLEATLGSHWKLSLSSYFFGIASQIPSSKKKCLIRLINLALRHRKKIPPSYEQNFYCSKLFKNFCRFQEPFKRHLLLLIVLLSS